MSRVSTKFLCHISADNEGYFWQAENFPSVLVGYPFKGKSNAVASCNRFMVEHNFEWEWENAK